MTSVSIVAESSQADYGRPASIEERSNRFFIHPLSGIVARAAIRIGVSANQVSLLGLASGLLAAFFYYQQSDRAFVIAGLVAMIGWHVFDGADGRIARATGTSSPFGRILDGICDYLVFITVYVSIALFLTKTGSPPAIWFLVVAALASHGVQAAAYEERRQRYQRRLNGVDRLTANANLLSVNGSQAVLAIGYDSVQKLVSGSPGPLDRALEQLRAKKTSASIIQSAVNRTALVVRRWSILNANNRTFMIALPAFFGQPALYFVYEVVVLNAVLLMLLIYEKQVETIIVRDLAPTLDQH